MTRRTLAQLRSLLARQASISGLDAASTRFTELLNLAIEELMMESDFPQTMARVRFNVVRGEFTLPYTLERALEATIDDSPIPMRSPWLEFVEFGTGTLGSDDTCFIMLDRDSIPTARTIPDDGTNYYLRVKSDVNEDVDGTPPTIILRGYDENDTWIRSTDGAGNRIDGVEVDIQTTANNTAVYFSRVTEVVKPVTTDIVRLYIWDGATETEIAAYQPQETVPNYKRYLIPSLEDDGSQTYVVQVRAKLAYRPLVSDNDIAIISNANALRAMLIALHAFDTNRLDEYLAHKQTALNLMAKEAQHFRGRVKQPAVSMAKDEGNFIPYAR